MIGIYKITSPSGKVYIGQSINILVRKAKHSNKPDIRQPKLYNSLMKYTFQNHKFEILQECKAEELDKLETHWKQFYLYINNWNWDKMLFCDIYDAKGGHRSEEAKKRIGEKNKKPKPIGFGDKIKALTKNKPHPILWKNIYQYDIKGCLIKKWNSRKELSNSKIISNRALNESLKTGKICNNYVWKYN